MGLQGRRPRPHTQAGLDLELAARSAELPLLRRAFARLPLPSTLRDDARLLVNELVTNSIRHAGLGPTDRIRVIARLSRERLRVDVIDGATTPLPGAVVGGIRPNPGAESGWGLFLVETVASRWGLGRGRYWFELEWDGQERAV
jgi:anti-sigma regulatory factor (Ser/Thr protein kinase)